MELDIPGSLVQESLTVSGLLRGDHKGLSLGFQGEIWLPGRRGPVGLTPILRLPLPFSGGPAGLCVPFSREEVLPGSWSPAMGHLPPSISQVKTLDCQSWKRSQPALFQQLHVGKLRPRECVCGVVCSKSPSMPGNEWLL